MRFSFSAFASCLALVLLARQVPPLMYERVAESYAASSPGQHESSSGMSAMHPSWKPSWHGAVFVDGRRWKSQSQCWIRAEPAPMS